MRNLRNSSSHRSLTSALILSVCAALITLSSGPIWAVKHHHPATSPTPSPTPTPTPTPPPAPKVPAVYQVQPSLYYLPDEVKAAKAKTVLYDALKKGKDGNYRIHFAKGTADADQAYYSVHRDWCESITGVDGDASKNIAETETQIREPQGDVQVALPADPTKFVPVTDMMVIPDGALVKTGDGATVGILFGSVASARLIPNSIASVSHQLTDKSTIVVDLKSGGTFAKVAFYEDKNVSYQVKTSTGIVSCATGGKSLHAAGPDFAVYSAADHTDLFVLKGLLELDDTTGTKLGTVENKDKTVLIGKHIPAITDPVAALAATGQSLGELLSAISTINVKSKAILQKQIKHQRLTDNEEHFVKKMVASVRVYERLDKLPQPGASAQQITPPSDMTSPTTPTPTPMLSPAPDVTQPPAVTPTPTTSGTPAPTPTLSPIDPPTLPPQTTPIPVPTHSASSPLPPSLPMTPPSPTVPLPSVTPNP